VAQLLEVLHPLLVGHEPRAARHEVVELGAVGRERSALVEGDLVDAELVVEVGEQADERLTDGAGADHVDDLLHGNLTMECPALRTDPNCLGGFGGFARSGVRARRTLPESRAPAPPAHRRARET
jgi:hypothetical protein